MGFAISQKIKVCLAVTILLLCGFLSAYLFFIHEFAVAESTEEEEVGLFKGEKVCLFSGFDGQLTFNGEPAAGAEITRVYEWKNKEHREVVIADSEGRFEFESVWDVQRGFVVQFVSYQKLLVKNKGEEYQVWGAGKLSEAEYWEFGGSRPVNLRCEVTDPIRRIDLTPGFVGTNCHWG